MSSTMFYDSAHALLSTPVAGLEVERAVRREAAVKVADWCAGAVAAGEPAVAECRDLLGALGLDVVVKPPRPAAPSPRPAPRPSRLPRLPVDWMDRAACRGEDVVLFFGPDGEQRPERDRRERKAKAICSGCPVSHTCLDHALGNSEKGFWGGLNEDERAFERRRRMRRAARAREAVGAVPAATPEVEAVS